MNTVGHEFEGFRLDTRQRRLTTREGLTVDLQPRVFDALVYFVERPGELLGKRELLQALWPNVVVEENSLNQVVSQLRKALGEKPSEHRFIVTSPGRGYRFVAAVRSLPETQESGGTHPLSLAVLPFADRQADAGVPELGDAIAADLIRLLSARSRLRVAALAAGDVQAARSQDPRQMAAALHVHRLVTGEVAGDARDLRVTAHVRDAATAAVLWTRTLRGNIQSLAELQGDLARDVAQIVDPESSRTPAVSLDVAPDAYLGYLKALAITQRLGPDTVASAIAELRRAVELSPRFSRGHSLLAIQYTTAVMFGFSGGEALDLARQEVTTALALDDENGETYGAAAVIDCLGGNWCRAEERFRIAHSLTADPLISGLRCAYLTFSMGQVRRALQQAEYTLQVAPTHPIGVQILATLHMALEDEAQARRFATLSVELGQSPSMAPLTDLLAQLALRTGAADTAAAHMRSALPEHLQGPALDDLLPRLCRETAPAEATRIANGLAELVAAMLPHELDPPMRKRLLFWFTRLGALDHAYDLAFASLDHFAREGNVGGAWGVLWLPELGPFRHDERFQLFARRLRMFDYWSEYGPPDGYSLSGERLIRAA